MLKQNLQFTIIQFWPELQSYILTYHYIAILSSYCRFNV